MLPPDKAKRILDETFPEYRGAYQDSVALRMSKYFSFLKDYTDDFKGKIIDVGGQYGNFLALAECIFPYLTEMTLTRYSPKWDSLVIGTKTVRVINCHFERDQLPLDEKSFSVAIFTEVLEHLLYDPVWTILEINRILRDSGILFLATPNASSMSSIIKILRGKNPFASIEYKPTRLFERHNRLYTSREVIRLLENCGFQILNFSTMPSKKVRFLAKFLSILYLANQDFPQHSGSATMVLAKKQKHLDVTKDLPKKMRWPSWLYSPRKELCKRPDYFIEAEDD